jgi:endoglucanase
MKIFLGQRHRLLRAAASCLALGLGLASMPSAWAGCLGDKPLRGVNMAGAEFNTGKMPGAIFKDYTYPAEDDLRYFKDQGANAIRLPFRWERMQRTLNGPLEGSELKEMKKAADVAQRLDLCLILDAHNYGTYASQPIGSAEVPAAAFSDFWVKMNEAFPKPDNIAFDLMNEPAKAPRRAWAQAAKDTVAALRSAGSKHLILVSGAGWSGAHDWMKGHEGLSNADAFADLRDPLKRTWIEVHQYADHDSSGTHTDCNTPDRMRATLDAVTRWAKDNDQKLFLGEFGVGSSPACLETLRAEIEIAGAAPWAGWTYWAAGRWWGQSYPFNVHPKEGLTREQLPVLKAQWQ